MAEIQVAHCPERVLPGRILEEVVNNPRVIGGMTRRCAQRAVERANLVLLLVDHQGFLQVDRDVLKDKFVIDTRGVW